MKPNLTWTNYDGTCQAQYEDQSKYVRKLSAALKHTQLEVERRSVAQQRGYEEKIGHALRQMGGAGGGDGTWSGDRKMRYDELNQRDNRDYANTSAIF